MHKLLMTVVALVFAMQSFGQYYPSVTKDFFKIDNDNVVYKPGAQFNYSVAITKNGEPLYIAKNDSLSFELTDVRPSNPVDEFSMVVLKARPFKRHTLRQTDIAYIFNNDFTADIERSTLVENKKNTWFQLPTYGFFQLLHQAGAPYVKTPLVDGKDWHDRNMIEDTFANEAWETWNYTLSTSHDYQIQEKVNVQTEAFGPIECYEIASNTKSRIGDHKMTSYYSPKYGFVAMNYEFFSGYKVNIALTGVQTIQTEKPLKNIEVLKQYFEDKKNKINDRIVLE